MGWSDQLRDTFVMKKQMCTGKMYKPLMLAVILSRRKKQRKTLKPHPSSCFSIPLINNQLCIQVVLICNNLVRHIGNTNFCLSIVIEGVFVCFCGITILKSVKWKTSPFLPSQGLGFISILESYILSKALLFLVSEHQKMPEVAPLFVP